MKEIVPIFYACDDNFVKYTIVSIRSLLDNCDKNKFYKIHILHTDVSKKMQDEACRLSCEYAKIIFVNVLLYMDKIKTELPIRDYYSKTTYYRLFIAEMFVEYDKAIYIDSDTIVKGDIYSLYNHDLGDNYIGAAHEQVMVQVDIYGDYVEKAVGIKRDNYFNAGIILINCNKFRSENVLKQFIDLLDVYNFVVVQDEDYLNVICHNKVLWLDQKYNSEVFCELLNPIDEIVVLHYIMTAKPWHYADCRLKEYFWEYAKKTCVYDEILEELNNYSDLEKENDKLIQINLAKLAQSEIDKEDNYYNMIKR